MTSETTEKCGVWGCENKAVIVGLCGEHHTAFIHWRSGLRFQYGDNPNGFALLTSFLLCQIPEDEKARIIAEAKQRKRPIK